MSPANAGSSGLDGRVEVPRPSRHDTQKKTAHASEQERADVKAARQAWCERQPEFDPERLFFVDESGLSTKMARMRGWAPKGQRCRASIPHGHWKTTTFVGALSLSGIGAPMLLDGAMDGEAFLDWCEQMLAPLLKPGDSVIMDNLPAHKVAGVREAVEATGATLIYLQPRLQPHRERLLQAQSPWAKGRRANRRSLGRRCRHSSTNLQPKRMRKLLRTRRIRLGLTGICSLVGVAALLQFVVDLLPEVGDKLLAELLTRHQAFVSNDRLPRDELLAGRRLIERSEVVDLIHAEISRIDFGQHIGERVQSFHRTGGYDRYDRIVIVGDLRPILDNCRLERLEDAWQHRFELIRRFHDLDQFAGGGEIFGRWRRCRWSLRSQRTASENGNNDEDGSTCITHDRPLVICLIYHNHCAGAELHVCDKAVA